MIFSGRTTETTGPNEFLARVEEKRLSPESFFDLTVSNPTQAKILYPEEEIRAAMESRLSFRYEPDPRGLKAARLAVAEYYQKKDIAVDPESVVITAGTSDAYSYLFRLLCNPGDAVLCPVPGYPLIPILAELDGVRVEAYPLSDNGWRWNPKHIEDRWTKSVRAIMAVSPSNPTGAVLRVDEVSAIRDFCADRSVALVVDEVFLDYPAPGSRRNLVSTAGPSEALTFTLGGLSKSAGLPQLKLSWIVVQGEQRLVEEARRRLEFISDAYLSVGSQVQAALPALLSIGETIRAEIRNRVDGNEITLRAALADMPGVIVFPREAGWYAVIGLPTGLTDEMVSMQLLEDYSTLVHPGYWFDFEELEALVISLLPPLDVFSEGIERLKQFLAGTSREA